MAHPTTRMYVLRSETSLGPWARIWITDDGCFTTISDHGNYGYWWGQPGCEFRKFLCGCDDDYLGSKLSGGEREFDGDGTVKNIRRRILEWRRERSLTRERAAKEWSLVCDFSNMDNEVEAHGWYEATELQDASELLEYRIPIQLQMFLKHLWPRFVELLREELAAESVATQLGG